MTAIIIPTYNEADNIAQLVSQILAVDLSIHVVIVDDNSPDGMTHSQWVDFRFRNAQYYRGSTNWEPGRRQDRPLRVQE